MLRELASEKNTSREILTDSRWQADRTCRFDECEWLAHADVSQNGTQESSEKIWLFSLEQWLVADQKLNLQDFSCGLILSSDDDVSLVQHALSRFDVIVIEFPHFNDGRGFSLAAQLRERFGYSGELRAEGYVLVDQLYYLKRCGFDSFSFRNPVDREEAVSALQTFSVSYQSSSS